MTTDDDRPTDPDLAAAFAQLQALNGQLELRDAIVERMVTKLRLEGASWSEVAAALSCSKSYAHEKFQHVDQAAGTVEMRKDAGGRAFFFSTALRCELFAPDHAAYAAADELAAVQAGTVRP